MFYDTDLSGVMMPKTVERGFTYDGNGNMTGNPAIGVDHIEWDETVSRRDRMHPYWGLLHAERHIGIYCCPIKLF